MVEWNVPVPDDLDVRTRSHLDKQGLDLSDFVAKAVSEQLAYEEDEALVVEITESIKRGMTDVENGRTEDARGAMHKIAAKHGLNLPR